MRKVELNHDVTGKNGQFARRLDCANRGARPVTERAMPPSHITLVILATLAWGGNIPAIKLGLNEMSPFLFLSLRFLGLLILMLPWLRWRRGRMKDLVVVSLLLGPLHFGIMFVGMDLVADASVVAVLAQLNVPFAAILGVVVLGERIRIWRGAGIGLAFIGVMVMMFEPRVFQDRLGVALVIFSAFMYAMAAVRIRRLQDVGVFELQAMMAAVSVPVLLALSFVLETGQAEQVAALTTQGYVALAYTIVMASLFGHGVSYFLLQRNPVSTVTPFFLLTPVFGVVLSVIILHEVLSPRMIAGALVTFAGVAVVTYRERMRAVETGR